MSTISDSVDLLEYVASTPQEIDRDAGLIRGVKVLGFESSNGRRYTRVAVSRAKSMYEGVRVNIDHPCADDPDQQRNISDRFGRLENVRETEDGLYADLRYLREHPLAPMVLEAAESMPDTFGLSHNAEGRVTRDGERTLVEEIVHVRSVDLVSNPATNHSLFESQGACPMPTTNLTSPLPESDANGSCFREQVESLLEVQRPLSETLTQLTTLVEETRRNLPADNVSQLQEVIKRLRVRETVREMIDRVGLTPEPELIEGLCALPNDQSRERLLQGWSHAADATPATPRSSQSRPAQQAVPQDPTDSVAFLRGQR
jgi:hypothetical protein